MAEQALPSPPRALNKRWGRLKRSNSCEQEPDAPRPTRQFLKKRSTAVDSPAEISELGASPESSHRHGVFGGRRSNDDGLLRSNNSKPEQAVNCSTTSPKASASRNRFRRGHRRSKSANANRDDSDSADENNNNVSIAVVKKSSSLFKKRKGKNTKKKKKGNKRSVVVIKSDGEQSSADEAAARGSHSADEALQQARRGRRQQFLMQSTPPQAGNLLASSGHSRSESIPSVLRKTKSNDEGGRSGSGGGVHFGNTTANKEVSFDFNSDIEDDEPGPLLNSKLVSFGGRHQEDDFKQNTTEDNFGYSPVDFPGVLPPPEFKRDITGQAVRMERRTTRERARYSIYQGNSSVKKRFRVRPYHCFSEPTYMTEEDIYADSLTASQDFEPLKSFLAPTSRSTKKVEVPDRIREMWGSPQEDGRIGAIRVEVLGCVSLNRTKPDVSVYAVCGDSAFCTDVLNGYRSPMWPSVSRRACIFPIHHAYAKLYVGVFDARRRKNKENDVFCGRVVIDIASIRPDTEYDTTMPLRGSAFVYDKRKRGVVRLRFSLHWFSERAAVISYFKSVRSLVDSCPLVEGQPAIPCADPKTFRNVAVTVYGEDLPGKYSRNAFRATMREFNLYQQNLRLLIKVLVLDAMLYEKPKKSLYLFAGAMYCVFNSSVRMVPAIFVGYILILYIENYFHFVEEKQFNLGYKPLTVEEVFKALILNSEGPTTPSVFEPLSVQKRTKRRRASQLQGRSISKDEVLSNASEEEQDDGSVVGLDHREFPFSDRDAYPKFKVEDSLAPGSGKGGTGRLHGRLSVYYTPDTSQLDSGESGDEEEDSDMDSDRDDETVMTESQMIGDNMFDLDSDAEEDEEASMDGMDFNYRRAMQMQSQSGAANNKSRRLKLGPPQDSDVSGRKVPPQVQLKKVEHMLYKASRSVSVELVHAPPRAKLVLPPADATSSGMTAPSAAVQASVNKRAQKIPYDDFDKLLGLQTRSANPVHRIMSSFMGPLMRMIRVGVYLVRISFNASTWRDPYLSFWLLVLLCALCLLLIVFPWRSFFFVSSVVCLGPQNIFVRRYLEKKAAADAAKDDESSKDASEKKSYYNQEDNAKKSMKDGNPRDRSLVESSDGGGEKADGKRGFFSKFRQQKETNRAIRRLSNRMNSMAAEEPERPAFQSDLHGQSGASKKLQPRSVAIPYSRLKKDRFYDWPPDPTVSRATPMYPEEQSNSLDDSLTASVPSVVIDDQDDYPSNLRRRGSANANAARSDIPMNIAF